MTTPAFRRIGRLSPSISTALFVCDIQEKFAPLISHMPSVVHVAKTTIKSANILKLPIFMSEQYPKGLGKTLQELESLTSSSSSLTKYEKMKFSMMVPEVEKKIDELKIKSVLLVGIEAHVCVLQTALDLLEKGIDVHILADGVSSQRPFDRFSAFERMKQSGAFISTSESTIFQLLESAENPSFKAVQSFFKITDRPDTGLLPSFVK